MLGTIDQLAKELAKEMQTVHGGEWRIDIEHALDEPFVVIRLRGRT